MVPQHTQRHGGLSSFENNVKFVDGDGVAINLATLSMIFSRCICFGRLGVASSSAVDASLYFTLYEFMKEVLMHRGTMTDDRSLVFPLARFQLKIPH
jgi:hypothetical protein